jgi:hypothetical protein
MLKAVVMGIVVGTAIGLVSANAAQPNRGAFTGTIVDAATGKPIPGAACIAIWEFERDTESEDIPRTVLVAGAGVADAQGRYTIPEQPVPDGYSDRTAPPILDCSAPGYSNGGGEVRMTIRLTALANDTQAAGRVDPLLRLLPSETCAAAVTSINVSRAAMRLPRVDICPDPADKARLIAAANEAAKDPSAVDARIQAAWKGLKDALRSNDVPAALQFVHSEYRARYQALWAKMPPSALEGIDAVLTSIRPVKTSGGAAEYEMLRVEDGRTFSYLVRFAVDNDGAWRVVYF